MTPRWALARTSSASTVRALGLRRHRRAPPGLHCLLFCSASLPAAVCGQPPDVAALSCCLAQASGAWMPRGRATWRTCSTTRAAPTATRAPSGEGLAWPGLQRGVLPRPHLALSPAQAPPHALPATYASSVPFLLRRQPPPPPPFLRRSPVPQHPAPGRHSDRPRHPLCPARHRGEAGCPPPPPPASPPLAQVVAYAGARAGLPGA